MAVDNYSPEDRTTVKDELKHVKIDGFSNIFRSRHINLKCIWVLVLILSAICCLVLIVKSVQEYLHYEVTTRTRLLAEQESVFPTITICNFNPYTTPYADALFSSANITNDVNNIWLLDKYWRETTGHYLNDAQKEKMSDLNDILISCQFGFMWCNVADFEFMYHPLHHNCYRFNSDAAKRVLLSGEMSALKIDLYTGLTDSQNYPSNILSKGFNVFIQNHTDYPYNYAMTPYKVSPGHAMSFSIQRSIYTQYNAWPYAYSECTVDERGELMRPLADSSFFDLLSRDSNSTYFRFTCYELCYQKIMAEMCNCSCYSIRVNVGDYDYCFPPIVSECETKYRDEKFLNFDWFAANCLTKCPLECSKPTLDRFLSSYDYPPSALYADMAFKNNPTLYSLRANQSEFQESKQSNMIRLVFYYDTLSYVTVDEEPKMTLDALIGTVGGHLHLFLGMSLLSFVEIGMISLKCVYFTFKIGPKAQRKPKNTIISINQKQNEAR